MTLEADNQPPIPSMDNIHEFHPSDRMVTLVSDNYRLLEVMSRFGIRVGFGDKSVAEVCAEQGVDTSTFLAVVNFITGGYTHLETRPEISIPSLLQYLTASHSYFLDFQLPAIRRKLLDGIEFRTNDVSFLIVKFFDEYMAEVRTHMEYEEKNVFAYVSRLMEGKIPDNFQISTYSKHHEQVGAKLGELKSLILKYCPPTASVNLLNTALYDIYRCEQELESHCLLEDCIFVPAIVSLEKRLRKNDA